MNAIKEAERVVRPGSARLEVTVDCPHEGEIIVSSEYTFRIGTVPEALRVEVSLNRGEWQECRESLGLWWFDWSNYAPGGYRLEARIHAEGGKTVVSLPCRFRVVAPDSVN